MQRSKFFFHPVFVLACAATGILVYVAVMRWRFAGGNLSNHFVYVLPIIVPFVAFLFDRANRVSPFRGLRGPPSALADSCSRIASGWSQYRER